jgi:hypothetical protein
VPRPQSPVSHLPLVLSDDFASLDIAGGFG